MGLVLPVPGILTFFLLYLITNTKIISQFHWRGFPKHAITHIRQFEKYNWFWRRLCQFFKYSRRYILLCQTKLCFLSKTRMIQVTALDMVLKTLDAPTLTLGNNTHIWYFCKATVWLIRLLFENFTQPPKFWHKQLACAVTELSVHYLRRFCLFLSSSSLRPCYFSPRRGYRRGSKFCMGF